MASPFAAAATRTGTSPRSLNPATGAQLGFILRLVGERNWQDGKDSWVRRIANIAVTLRVAEEAATNDRLVEQLDIALDDRASLFNTFHQLMDYSWHSAVNDERDPSVHKALTKDGARKLIDHLLDQPIKPSAAESAVRNASRSETSHDRVAVATAEQVPAGRYAVETEDGATNELAFYKVDRPTEGRWAGRVFVKLMVSDGEQRLSWAATKSVLAKIAAVGAAEASARYGHEIGECGVCGRTLTNDESRARGIGPVCVAKQG